MKPIVPILAILLLGPVLAASAADAAKPPAKLNLLYITADDMNWDSPGWMGGTMQATPVLDAFAATCHRFINDHVSAPICQPSREAMMTGRVPHRSGGLGFNPIKPGTPTLATTLKNNGYYIAAMNKLTHMMPAAEFPWDTKMDGSGKNPPLLREQFETLLKNATAAGKPFFINVNIQYPHRPFPGSNAADAEEGDSTKSKDPNDKAENPDAKPDAPGAKPAPATLSRKDMKALKKKGGNVDSLARVYKPEEIKVPDFLEDIPPVRVEVAQYYTAVARVDVSLNGILEALKESGHEDDTLILFMSDHGMSFPFSKATVYYNGTHSPVIFKYPGMPAATVHDEWVSSVDIMPTLLDILGVQKPDGMDGRSWVPLLNGEKQEGRDYVITNVNTVSSSLPFPQRCVRTKDWALMFESWPDGTAKFKVEAMSGITYKALAKAGEKDARIGARVKQYRVGEPLQFFNEQTDPSERSNAINDKNYAPEIKRLGALMIDYMDKTGDPQTANFKKAFATWEAAAK